MMQPATAQNGKAVRLVVREGFEVGIVGSGCARLVTEAYLSHLGHRLRCLDDERRLAGLAEYSAPNDGRAMWNHP
jgi:NADPH-dependent glutamate synthase beta subunit-like oxidoreductase